MDAYLIGVITRTATDFAGGSPGTAANIRTEVRLHSGTPINEDAAGIELERLAAERPGLTFYLLHVERSYKSDAPIATDRPTLDDFKECNDG